MGHIRLGIIPKTRRWSSIIAQLDDANIPTVDIANSILNNVKDVLEGESAQSCVEYCVWLFSQLALSSKRKDFFEDISSLGINVDENTSAVEFLAKVSQLSGRKLADIRPHSAINNISSLALRETLTKVVGCQTNTLFGNNMENIQESLKKYSTQKQFSNLLHMFFSSFLERTLNFVLDKELSNHMGYEKRFSSITEIESFKGDISTFAGQTTRIIDTFSGGWYSNKIWKQGNISTKDASGFAFVALKKLRSDLSINQAENI